MTRHPVFERRHYETIAQKFSECYDGSEQFANIVYEFALMFAADNPNFNLNRFLDAVYGTRKEVE